MKKAWKRQKIAKELGYDPESWFGRRTLENIILFHGDDLKDHSLSKLTRYERNRIVKCNLMVPKNGASGSKWWEPSLLYHRLVDEMR